MEDQDEDPALLEVAEAVSAGNPVNWESAQSRHDPTGVELSHLQALEAVAAAHRSARLDSENIGGPSADDSLGRTWGGPSPETAEPRLGSTGAVPSSRRNIGMIRAAVGLAFALVALYFIFRVLWKP